MTAREMFMMSHPDLGDTVDETHCPDEFGYLLPPANCNANCLDKNTAPMSCKDCWDREVPGTVESKSCNELHEEYYEKTFPTSNHMTRETFEKLLDELDGQSLETLKTKNARYASSDDTLHNFNAGAEIMGVTPAQCAWGYATKHLVALRDKIMKDDFSDRDDLLEKCQDIINYIRFIWCLANQGRG